DSAQFKLKQKEITQLPAIPLKLGDYKMIIIAKDASDTTRIDKFDFDINVPIYKLDEIKISSIQLSTSIKETTGKAGMFDKFGYEVVPNPNQFFGNNLNLLYFYFEVYGLKTHSDKVLLKKIITNINDSVISQITDRIQSSHNIMVETGSFKIDTLESGTYYLKVNILDDNNNLLTSSEKKFYVYNTIRNIVDNTAKENADFLKSEYATMSESQLDDEFEKAVYIRTDEETKNYKALNNLDAKRKFMYIFWTKRDNTPQTQANEYKINYFKRIENANKMFKEPFQEGWRTDRGRIYMIYGAPNDIERFDYEADIRSYQIWHYETIEGGTICVFAESNYSGSGIYELVHSTIRGELRNDDWKNQLKKK
ncbi:MAG: GWxTD domain-containing protein, partial [Ignavibacteria bacterium]|nr:GWxTD domain-containing protein [Ignavibacteria bacterium]